MDSSDSKLRDIAAQLDINSDELEAIKNDKKYDFFDLKRSLIIVAVVSAFLGFLSGLYFRPFVPQTYPYAPLAVGITFPKNSLKKIVFFSLVIGIHLVIAIVSFYYSIIFTHLLAHIPLPYVPQPAYGVFYKTRND